MPHPGAELTSRKRWSSSTACSRQCGETCHKNACGVQKNNARGQGKATSTQPYSISCNLQLVYFYQFNVSHEKLIACMNGLPAAKSCRLIEHSWSCLKWEELRDWDLNWPTESSSFTVTPVDLFLTRECESPEWVSIWCTHFIRFGRNRAVNLCISIVFIHEPIGAFDFNHLYFFAFRSGLSVWNYQKLSKMVSKISSYKNN